MLNARNIVLVDAKKNGSILARIDGDVLIFEQGHLSDKTLDDITVTAVALAELRKRVVGSSDVSSLSQSIGDTAIGIFHG
jgi:hypothetical protein